MKIPLQLTPECIKALVEYLIDHDDDIEIGINDFNTLRIVYKELIGEYDEHKTI